MRDVHLLNALMFDDTTSYGLLKIPESNPGLAQRDLAKHLSISLGKVDFCLNALIEKSSLKVNNFRNGENKPAYAGSLTPPSADRKARSGVPFFKAKMPEYRQLRPETNELEHDAGQNSLLEESHG